MKDHVARDDTRASSGRPSCSRPSFVRRPFLASCHRSVHPPPPLRLSLCRLVTWTVPQDGAGRRKNWKRPVDWQSWEWRVEGNCCHRSQKAWCLIDGTVQWTWHFDCLCECRSQILYLRPLSSCLKTIIEENVCRNPNRAFWQTWKNKELSGDDVQLQKTMTTMEK